MGESVRAPRRSAAAPSNRRVDAATAAWLVTIPCAVATVVAIVLLGPPIGSLTPQPAAQFWPVITAELSPEHTEHARYLIALAGPILLVLATLQLAGHPLGSSAALSPAVLVTQVACAGLLVACIVAQYRIEYRGAMVADYPVLRYFTPATLLASLAFAAAAIACARTESIRSRVRGWLQERPSRAWIALGIAVAATAVWLLHAIDTDRSTLWAAVVVRDNVQYTLDEAFAVVNGRTPLVDFTAQYGHLWPYVTALSLSVFGKSLLVFTITMCALTGLAHLAIFGVLRRVTHSSAAALALYLPFLATSLFTMLGTTIRYSPANYFGIHPLRYAGPLMLAWVVARHLDRPPADAVRRLWLLFTFACLVCLNNLEFGLPALGATVTALLWTAGRLTGRVVLRLVAGLALGVATAAAVLVAIALLRAQALPEPGRLFDYPRLYGLHGFANYALQGALGLHIAIYATFVAAIGVATVRALQGEPNRVLTGMLVWSGIFGLGSGSYFMGHSAPDILIASFGAWALSVVLLTVVSIQRLAAGGGRASLVAHATVLVGMGILVCSLAQVPAPWSQLDRLDPGQHVEEVAAAGIQTPWLPDPAARDFYAATANGPARLYYKPGAPVAILTTLGHRTADVFGVVNVSRYTGITSITTVGRLREVVDDLRAAGGNTLLLPSRFEGAPDRLARWGFGILTTAGVQPYARMLREPGAFEPVVLTELGQTVTKWVDLRNLRPAALSGDAGELVETYRRARR